MASDERKAADDKIMAENLHKSLGAQEQGAETEGFQCHRCKQVTIDLPMISFPRSAY
jgi:transcription elongation factor S-II